MPQVDSLSTQSREAIALAMRAIVADISECEWAAGWMSDIEYTLWRDLIKGDRPHYGYTNHGIDMVPVLRELSGLIDGWVDSDGYVPMAEWLERVETRKAARASPTQPEYPSK